VCYKTDYVTQKHLNHCWLNRKNFAVHSYCTAWIIIVSTAVVNYVLYINLLPQTLDIKPRFALQFVVYCILLIVSIQLLLLYQINRYYYCIIITVANSCAHCAVCRKHLHSQPQHSVYCSTLGLCLASSASIKQFCVCSNQLQDKSGLSSSVMYCMLFSTLYLIFTDICMSIILLIL